MDKQTTAQLVERARDGDEAAFERLYHLHCRQVYTLCLRMASNRAEAEDMTQEAFLQAFRKLGTSRGETSFSTWIYRIAFNVVLVRRRGKVHSEVSPEDTTNPNASPTPTFKFIGHPDSTRELVGQLSLRSALDQLPEGYRRVAALHNMHGYGHDEVAQMTGRTTGSPKSQLHKARRKLRELLAPIAMLDKGEPA